MASKLKSPVPLISQLGPGLNGPAAPANGTLLPFISQIAGIPLSFCHRMSDMPSPLKSPSSSMCQLGPGLNGPTGPANVALAWLCINQIMGVPSLFCSRTSLRPLPLKSSGFTMTL